MEISCVKTSELSETDLLFGQFGNRELDLLSESFRIVAKISNNVST